jgi:hypothetical protein
MNLEAIAKIAKKREEDLQAEILSGSLRQERLKKQLQECSRNKHQSLATATMWMVARAAEELQLQDARQEQTTTTPMTGRRSCSMTSTKKRSRSWII